MENAPAPAWPNVDATRDGSYHPRGRSPAPGQKNNEVLAKPSKLVPKDSFRIAIQARDGYDDPTRNLQFPGARAIESASSSSESLHRSTPPTAQDDFDIQQPIPDPKPVNDLQSPNSPTFVTPTFDAEALLRSLSPTPGSRQSPLPRVNSQEPLSPDIIPPNPRSPSPLPPLPPLDAVDEETSSPDSADGQADSPSRPQRIVRFKSRVRISSGRAHHHYPNDYANPTLSRSSSVSDSSSISAPLRSAPESLLVFPTHTNSLDQTFSAEDFNAWLNENGGMGGKKAWHLGADGDDGASSDADDPDERSALLAHRRRRGPPPQQQYMAPHYGVPPMNRYHGPPNLGVKTNMGPPRGLRTPPTGSPLSPPRRRRGGYGSLTASPASETRRMLRSPGGNRRRRRGELAQETSGSWGWLSPMQWWAGLKFILCCGAATQEDPTDQQSASA
ncbi:hypothetical protein M407DRAFT_139091 [Tulasnella calospora MUT 4182]|uniref:Uncharacterized protein n=1 Tax=Tulasnella calospora MUT 4182 TaxID=1051891 RepID=A0A0C3QSX9_9AGAM|nr:hypothetical protein M407DRAFT_139091 [Tulasnella calospora MUT 4182]